MMTITHSRTEDIVINLKPIPNREVQAISAACFEWWKRYNKLSSADPDKSRHFTEAVWTEICGYTDDSGVYHKGTFDEVYDKYPYELTSNMLGVFLEELQARDRGSYHAIDYEADNAFTRALNRINYRRNVNEIYSL